MIDQDGTDARLSSFILLRPSSYHDGNAAPQAALIVTVVCGEPHRGAVISGLLRYGWDLAAPPVGEWMPSGEHHVDVALDPSGQARISDGHLVVYDGPITVGHSVEGQAWWALAQAGALVVFLTAGPETVTTPEMAEAEARAGMLLGVAGRVPG